MLLGALGLFCMQGGKLGMIDDLAGWPGWLAGWLGTSSFLLEAKLGWLELRQVCVRGGIDASTLCDCWNGR